MAEAKVKYKVIKQCCYSNEDKDSGVFIHLLRKKHIIRFNKESLKKSSTVISNLLEDTGEDYIHITVKTNEELDVLRQLFKSLFLKKNIIRDVPSPLFLESVNFYDMKHLRFTTDMTKEELSEWTQDYVIGPVKDYFRKHIIKFQVTSNNLIFMLTDEGSLMLSKGKTNKVISSEVIISGTVIKDICLVNLVTRGTGYKILLVDEKNNLSIYLSKEIDGKIKLDKIVDAQLFQVNKKIIKLIKTQNGIFALCEDGTIAQVYTIVNQTIPEPFKDGTIKVKDIYSNPYRHVILAVSFSGNIYVIRDDSPPFEGYWYMIDIKAGADFRGLTVYDDNYDDNFTNGDIFVINNGGKTSVYSFNFSNSLDTVRDNIRQLENMDVKLIWGKHKIAFVDNDDKLYFRSYNRQEFKFLHQDKKGIAQIYLMLDGKVLILNKSGKIYIKST